MPEVYVLLLSSFFPKFSFLIPIVFFSPVMNTFRPAEETFNFLPLSSMPSPLALYQIIVFLISHLCLKLSCVIICFRKWRTEDFLNKNIKHVDPYYSVCGWIKEIWHHPAWGLVLFKYLVQRALNKDWNEIQDCFPSEFMDKQAVYFLHRL